MTRPPHNAEFITLNVKNIMHCHLYDLRKTDRARSSFQDVGLSEPVQIFVALCASACIPNDHIICRLYNVDSGGFSRSDFLQLQLHYLSFVLKFRSHSIRYTSIKEK
jgi:hypothetical protein